MRNWKRHGVPRVLWQGDQSRTALGLLSPVPRGQAGACGKRHVWMGAYAVAAAAAAAAVVSQDKERWKIEWRGEQHETGVEGPRIG